MPAPSSRVLPAAAASVLDHRRRSERRRCNLQVTLQSEAGAFTALLLDLSAGGIGFQLAAFLSLRPGSRLTLVHPQLGNVPCVLRWAMHPRYGAEFEPGRQALRGVNAVYDSLPPAQDDTF